MRVIVVAHTFQWYSFMKIFCILITKKKLQVAQVLAVQQQQRALAAAAAAHHSAAAHSVVTNPLLQASALQNFAQNLMANGVNNQQPTGQTFFCIFCMKHFNTQASFTLHLSFVHFRNNVVNVSMQNCFQENFDKEVSFFFFFLSFSLSLSPSLHYIF